MTRLWFQKTLLSERDTNHYAQSSNIGSDVAERDIVLTYVLKILSEERADRPLLEQLAFKGGTCLRKVYFGKNTRFSKDLDFTACGVQLTDLRTRLRTLLNRREHYGIRFTIQDEFSRVDRKASYGAVIEYAHDWNSSSLDLNISFREKPCLAILRLALQKELYFRYCDFEPFEIPCMQKDELIAEKLRAASQRLRSRDLYDLYIYATWPYNRTAVRILTVIKHWNVRDPFNPDHLLDRVRRGEYDWFDLEQLVRPGLLPSQRTLVNKVASSFQFLREIDGDLRLLNEDARSHRRNELAISLARTLQ